jgi:hypothetical protein
MRNGRFSDLNPIKLPQCFKIVSYLKFCFSYTEIAMHDFRHFNSIDRQIVLRRIVNANKTYPHI